ncbi:MAG: Rrf2 family transcriptional regulator [Candidatus Eremiobacteraeota bacterium]|nr:Rrf2 family transcriptional regulator [Candidatus Eremiobacteraeota bacterium]
MSHILRVSEAASIAFHTMVLMAADPQKLFTAHQISQMLEVSENHLSKVMQRLAKAGLVKAERGPSGGYRIGKDTRKVTLLHVYEAIEGPMDMSACLLSEKRSCGDKCLMGSLLVQIDGLVRDYFERTHLADLAGLFRARIEEHAGKARERY